MVDDISQDVISQDWVGRDWVGRDWPQADALFRRDPRWLGGDDAYTVPLGGNRTLWLFGDTFLAVDGRGTRRDAATVHNSVAVQTGLNPTDCDWQPAWGTDIAGHPAALVETGDDTWLWPYDGVRLGDRLVLWFMHVRSTRPGLTFDDAWAAEGSLGFFDVFDWAAFVVDEPDAAPSTWTFRPALKPRGSSGAIVGAAVVEYEGQVLAYGYRPDGAVLCRWASADVRDGDLSRPQWWAGATGWTEEADAAVVVVPGAQTEFTVHQHDDGTWLHTEVTGFAEPDAVVSLRTAVAPEGPWSAPAAVHALRGRPPGTTLYAGKAHPELLGSDLVVTQVSIALDRDSTLADDDIYRPRFVRLDQCPPN